MQPYTPSGARSRPRRLGHRLGVVAPAGDEIAGHRHQVAAQPVGPIHPAGHPPGGGERAAVDVRQLHDPVAVEGRGRPATGISWRMIRGPPAERPQAPQQRQRQRGRQGLFEGDDRQRGQRERQDGQADEHHADRPPGEERPQQPVKVQRAIGGAAPRGCPGPTGTVPSAAPPPAPPGRCGRSGRPAPPAPAPARRNRAGPPPASASTVATTPRWKDVAAIAGGRARRAHGADHSSAGPARDPVQHRRT